MAGLAQHPAGDSARTSTIVKIIEAYNTVNKDSMFHYCTLLLSDARKSNEPLLLAQANKMMGIYWQNIRPSESLDYFRQAHEVYKKKGNREEVVNMNNLIAVTYYYMEDYDKQLGYLKKALQDALELDNKKLEISILHHISETYFRLNNSELAEEYSLMALQESRNNGNWMLDSIIITQAAIEFQKGNYRHSIDLSREVLVHARENKQPQMEMACMSNIAECMIKLKQYNEARALLAQCAQMTNLENNTPIICKNLQLMVVLDSTAGNFKQAFANQRQLEAIMAKKNSLEQLRRTSDKAAHAELLHLNMNLSHLLVTFQEQKSRLAKLNMLIVVIVVMAGGGSILLIRNRRSLGKLNMEQGRLIAEKASIAEKKNIVSGRYQMLSQAKEQLEETYSRLGKANRSKTELFKAISHDLQIPLIQLQQNLTVLMTADISEALFRQATNGLSNTVGDISLLLENLLQWSKFQSQGIDAKPQYTDVNALINDVNNQLKYSAAEKKITLANTLGKCLFVYADEELIKSLLKTILQNTLKLSNANASVVISGDKDNKNGWLQVRYDGQMPLKKMYLRLSHTTNYGSESTELGKAVGLGWMLCRSLVKANNGDIRIEDSSPETFSIYLYFPLEELAPEIKR